MYTLLYSFHFRYQDSSKYREIVNTVFKLWPHLVIREYVHSMTWWISCKDVFLSKILVKRLLIRGKYTKSKEIAVVTSAKKSKLFWGISDYLPNPPAGEDELSSNDYMKTLTEQHRYPKFKRNLEIVNNCIQPTFRERINNDYYEGSHIEFCVSVNNFY